MHQSDPERLPANVQAVGLDAYHHSIDAMLRRLADERLVERLWGRDPSLWYPAAATQARIRERLGWLDLPAADSEPIIAWMQLVRSRQATDLLYVGTGDAGLIARLWRDLTVGSEASRFLVLDTIEPSVVEATLAAVAWDRTAIALVAEADLTPDMDALARLVVAARVQAAPPNDPPLTVITPPDSALLPLVQAHTQLTFLPLPPDLGARFGPLSCLGLLPAALLGWDCDLLHAAALEMRALCRRGDDLTHNPGVWLGATLATLAQHGRDKLTLLASSELTPLTRWLAGFVSGSLSKHGRGFVAEGEQRDGRTKGNGTENTGEPCTCLPVLCSLFAPSHIVVALRLAGAADARLDEACAAWQAAGAVVLTLELRDQYAVAAQILGWQIAVATIGVALGLNPFDEPDTAARHAYLWRRLQQPDPRPLPPAPPLDAESLAEAWRQIEPTIVSAGCILIAAYLPPSSAVSEHLRALQSLLTRRFGALTIVVDPLRELAFATQMLHAGRPCALLLLTADPAVNIAVPGLAWTLNDLRHQRIAADLLAWRRMERRFAHLDLGAHPEAGLRRCLDLLASMADA